MLKLRSYGNMQLFDYLQQFSLKMVQKTKNLENELESLIFESKTAEINLNNCFNEFLMLSNSQFVEHVRSPQSFLLLLLQCVP